MQSNCFSKACRKAQQDKFSRRKKATRLICGEPKEIISMTGRELISRLKALQERLPSVEELNVQSPELLEMLGEAEALIGMWDRMDAIAINTKTQFIHIIQTS